MAQFDIFLNTGRRPELVPFFVSLQSSKYESSRSRFVGPLVPAADMRTVEPWLAPGFIIAGRAVAIDLSNLATLPVARLGKPIFTLADEDSRSRIIRALDEFLSQA